MRPAYPTDTGESLSHIDTHMLKYMQEKIHAKTSTWGLYVTLYTNRHITVKAVKTHRYVYTATNTCKNAVYVQTYLQG